jgi:sulfatase modifying factor 1
MTTETVTDRKAEYLAASPAPGPPPYADMVWIPGGTFLMGSEQFYPEERPIHPVSVNGFWMDRFEVTVADFRRFVQAAGYVTVAERPLDARDYPGVDPALIVPGSLVFQKACGPVRLDDYRNWWRWVPGASWMRPEGPGSNLQGRARHPITQVTAEDAEPFARWAGKTLPTEAEWEFAARGGLEGASFSWGNEFTPKNRMMANTWQGEFPWQNLRTDAFEGTSPVGTFPPNGYGLFDMAGNVWEMIESSTSHIGFRCILRLASAWRLGSRGKFSCPYAGGLPAAQGVGPRPGALDRLSLREDAPGRARPRCPGQ